MPRLPSTLPKYSPLEQGFSSDFVARADSGSTNVVSTSRQETKSTNSGKSLFRKVQNSCVVYFSLTVPSVVFGRILAI
ncbi:hypothetical protein SUGI_0701160 [Cryptomeria japonica]|nr:hypothetical protein SUGI_0701160 [Cryptomeria japonica]